MYDCIDVRMYLQQRKMPFEHTLYPPGRATHKCILYPIPVVVFIGLAICSAIM